MIRIRQIQLPKKSGVASFLTRADNIGAYTVASEECRAGYIVAPGEISIVTASGYLRMDTETAKRVCSELGGILEDVDDLERMGICI